MISGSAHDLKVDTSLSVIQGQILRALLTNGLTRLPRSFIARAERE